MSQLHSVGPRRKQLGHLHVPGLQARDSRRCSATLSRSGFACLPFGPALPRPAGSWGLLPAGRLGRPPVQALFRSPATSRLGHDATPAPTRHRRPILYFAFFLFGVTWIAAEGNARLMWERFHIPYLTPPFADTITVTYSLDAIAKGHDPYFYRGVDPFGRGYNYPRIWLGLRHLGLTGQD